MATVKEPDATTVDATPGRWMTEDAFVEWCDEDTKAEWVDGKVIVALPASSKHVRLAGFLIQIMGTFATQRQLGEVLGPELQVHFETLRRRRVPDVLFVIKDRLDIIKANHVEGAPDLIVEIASPDSLARDWREKYLEYEAAGVREYWVIDPMAERVEAYILNEEKNYTLIEEKDGVIHSTVLPEFHLKPTWLWQTPLPNPLEVLKELGVL